MRSGGLRFRRAACGAALLGTLVVGLLVPPGSLNAQEAEPAHAHEPFRSGDATPLREAGDAAFAAIREVVDELRRAEDTDWPRVDLEALRLHLRDMRSFTLEAEVVEREPIEGGLRVAVRGTDTGASDVIRRTLRAHASFLEQETGWSVAVSDRDDRTVVSVTSTGADEVAEIRALGYIGWMATGAHHQRHHWMIATGRSPHAH